MKVEAAPLLFLTDISFLLWVTPEYSIPLKKDNINLSGGALKVTIIGRKLEPLVIGDGLATLGSKNRNLSLALFYELVDKPWIPTRLEP